MKRLPILSTTSILLLLLLRLAPAWQTEPAATGSETTTSEKEATDVPVEDPQAVNLLRTARERLYKADSVQAKIVQRATFGNYRFTSTGSYYSGTDHRFRLEYEARLGDMEGRFLEVSDGQVIHTVRQLGMAVTGTEALAIQPQIDRSRRDVQAILQATSQHLDTDAAVQSGEVGLGGLPAVLASLERSIVFEEVRQERTNDRPMTVIRGRWRPQRRDQLLQALGPYGAQLAGYMPDQVRVVFDPETGLPGRIIYLVLVGEQSKVYKPILSVELVDMQLEGPLPPQIFNYTTPRGTEERDDTEAYLKMIAAGTSPLAAEAASAESVPGQPKTTP